MANFIENFRKAFPEQAQNLGKGVLKDTMTIAKTMHDNATLKNDAQKSIVQNTFYTDKNGVNYSSDAGGVPYTYVYDTKGKPTDFRIPTLDEQKKAIEAMSGGKIKIDPGITNQTSISDIHRSASRFYNRGANLEVGDVNIKDMYPNEMIIFGDDRQGTYDFKDGSIEINGLQFPDLRRQVESEGVSSGHNSGNAKKVGDTVITHELAHSTDNNRNSVYQKWVNDNKARANANSNKYTFGQLLRHKIDSILGDTTPISEKYVSLGDKQLMDFVNKKDRLEEELRKTFGSYSMSAYNQRIVDAAAKNLGITTEEAAKTISGYAAATDYSGRIRPYEIFAEAYTDVLLNGDDAAPYSKEVVKLYDKFTEKINDYVGVTKAKRAKELMGVLPDFKNSPPNKKSVQDTFIQNYRNTPWRKK